MRGKFTIWSGGNLVDCGLGRRRPTRAGRLSTAIVAVVVAGLGVSNVYSEIGANSQQGRIAGGVVSKFSVKLTSLLAAEPMTQPQMVGFAPVGVADRFTVPDSFATLELRPFVGPTANFAQRWAGSF
jgi:hypothetical protein